MPTNLMDMEELFYGPTEPSWLLPTYDDRQGRRVYNAAYDMEPPRRMYNPAAEKMMMMPRQLLKPEPPPRGGGGAPAHFYDTRGRGGDLYLAAEEQDRYNDPRDREPVYRQQRKVQFAPDVPVRTHDIDGRQIVNMQGLPPPKKDMVPLVQKPYKPPAIELKVPMCCEKCVKKVKDKLLDMDGVDTVVTDQYNQKVVVTGKVDPAKVLSSLKRVKKKSEFWRENVDYSAAYVRARKAEDAKVQMARAEATNNKAIANANANSKALAVSPAAPEVVHRLPQGAKGPPVTVVLPAPSSQREESEKRMPYESSSSRSHVVRYAASPPRGYVYEEEMMRPRARELGFNGPKLAGKHQAYDMSPGFYGRDDTFYDLPRTSYNNSPAGMRRPEFYDDMRLDGNQMNAWRPHFYDDMRLYQGGYNQYHN